MRGHALSLLWLVCLSFFGLMLEAKAKSVTVPLAGREVLLEVVKQDTLAPDPSFHSPIEITPRMHKMQTGESVFDLLKSERIRPDLEAITLLYDLNTKLSSLDALKVGDNVILPTILPGDKAALASAQDILLITLDPELKNRLKALIHKITSIVSQYQTSPNASPSRLVGIQPDLIKISAIFDQVRLGIVQGNGPVLSHRDLEVFIAQAEFTETVCSKVFSQQLVASEPEKVRVKSLLDDLNTESSRYNDVMGGQLPESTCKYTVKVSVPNAGTEAAQTLRIYYVEEGLWTGEPSDTAVPFPTLGNSSDYLCWRSYRFWAATDGHPAQKLTEVLPRSIQRDETLTLSLLGR